MDIAGEKKKFNAEVLEFLLWIKQTLFVLNNTAI